jgi:hypothetical protein
MAKQVIKSINLLPEIFRTGKNSKFLASTIDQLIQQPDLERIDGYIGSKLTPTYVSTTDNYIPEALSLRRNYQLEPALVIKDDSFNVTDVIGIDDLANEIATKGGKNNNFDRLFRSEVYSYNPHIDWDKLVNYQEYYWMVTGPETVVITGEQRNTTSTYTVIDNGQGSSFIFNPDGLTEDPVIELYKGNTYHFDVNSEFKFFVKTSPTLGNVDQYNYGVTNNGTSTGVLTIVVGENTPNTLYYTNDSQQFMQGQFAIKVLNQDTVVNVDIEIVGKKNYTSKQGIELTNGMKIRFGGTVFPESYREKEYFVEGVGKAIQLIDYTLLTSSQSIKNVYNENFDTTLFDDYPFDNYKSLPLVPEYITINRASQDLNPWSKYNRWVHSSVIKTSAEANGQIPVYPASRRAQRPIIEFVANLKLFNFGSTGIIDPVDFVDTVTADAFSKVEGSAGYYVDGVLLEQGHTVIFSADTDSIVRNKIFRVNYVKLNGRTYLELQTVASPESGATASINLGNKYAGTNWWFDGRNWQFAQQHNKLNQAPLFDLVDKTGNSYNDNAYYLSNFKGNKIFGYDIGTGANDSVLGFPLKYKNSSGVGSFLFKNYFMTETISISESTQVVTEISTADTYLKFVDNGTYSNVWTLAEDYQIPILQFQTIENQSTSAIEVTSIDNPANVDLRLEVFVNDDKYTDYTTSVKGPKYFVNFTTALNIGDDILLKIYTDTPTNDSGYYELPLSLTNNPLNGPITSLTLSELTDHLNTAAHRSPDFVGNFPGVSNLRDISNIAVYSTRLISNATPLAFANFFIGKKEHSVVDAITKAADQYNQFKISLLKQLTKLTDQTDSVAALDIALKEINLDKDLLSPYYLSDMLAYGTDKTVRTWNVTDVRNVLYPIASDFTLDTLGLRSVLVYLNGVQLINGIDYKFVANDSNIQIQTSLAVGDIITVNDYYSTEGSFVPATPTKLGLFPKFTPRIFEDKSYIDGPVNVIQGHDGSIMVAYNDFRDEIVLEFEKRIYNNIKTAYKEDLLDITSVMPGAFRTTDYSVDEINSILQSDFIKWAGFYGIDYSTNNITSPNNFLTWNYQGGYSDVVKKPVSGFWRAVLKYFYDTDRPDTCPWEMLGFSEKPTWWEDEYGPAPYTSGNELLWDDLVVGRIRQGNRAGTYPTYARAELYSLLPVDSFGDLVDTSTLLSTITEYNKRQDWKFGDQGPAETAWRRSSYWPFAVQRLLALTKPAVYASLMYDTSRMMKNLAGQWTYGADGEFLNIKNIFIHDDNKTLTSGYSVFVSEAGQQHSKEYITKLKTDLSNIDFNLFYKVGGFVSKDKLQILIDAYDPTTTGPGALLPQEDYNLILNTSNPVKSVGISGLIIQTVGDKFVVQGYDTESPYFTIYKPTRNSNTPSITVGGISESYVTWTVGSTGGETGLSDADTTTAVAAPTGKFYQAGQLVAYGNSFYRVKVSHQSGTTFNSAYFQVMPFLPTTGGATVQSENGFEADTTFVSYKTEFNTIQEVYDLIIGYGKWLETQGCIFDDYNTDFSSTIDWYFSGKEFLYWTTQKWADRSIITLSPFAAKIKYQLAGTVVDNIFDSFYQYSLLNASGVSFPQNNISVNRDEGVCTIETVNSTEGIYFAVIHSVQKEHAMVFNSTTIFNDTIYDIETGYRQRRMKLSGFRTANWNGDYFSPGFIYDTAQIADWKQYTDYKSGDLIRFASFYYSANNNITGSAAFNFTLWTKLGKKPVAGLLPNFDYKINQFEDFYSLDIDNFDSAQQKMAQHLTGYTPRVYLNNIFTNPIAQYKFYQGFIKEKGTRNAINKLSKATVQNFQGKIDFKEEWAFRIGHYGAFETYQEIEVPLKEGSFIENPQVINFVDSVPASPNDLIYYSATGDRIITPTDYVAANTFPIDTDSDFEFQLATAGYVRLDDVTATAYDDTTLLDIANNGSIQEGDVIWIGFKKNGDWDVSRYTGSEAGIVGVTLDTTSSELTFVTDNFHRLTEGGIVSVAQFGTAVNGIYIVKSIPSTSIFVVDTTLTFLDTTLLSTKGALYSFTSARFDTFDALPSNSDLLNLPDGTKFWVNRKTTTDNSWKVYQKVNNFNSITNTGAYDNEQIGYSIDKKNGNNIFVVGSPAFNTGTGITQIVGKVAVYERIGNSHVQKAEFFLNDLPTRYYDVVTSPTSEFGHCVVYDDIETADWHQSWASSITYTAGTIVKYGRYSYRCTTTHTSTPDIDLSKWYRLDFGLIFSGAPGVSYVGTTTYTSYVQQGLVKISSINSILVEEVTEKILSTPVTAASYQRFGSAIYVERSTGTKIMVISAPGTVSTGTGSVFAYSITANTSTVGVTYDKVLTAPVTLATGSQWGYDISGADNASIIAVGAPGYSTSTGVVAIFTGTTTSTAYQTITSPFGKLGRFGETVFVSADGTELYIGAPNVRNADRSYGAIVVYSRTTGTFNTSTYQIITNPAKGAGMHFGKAIDVTEDGGILVVSALGNSKNLNTTFDTVIFGATTFDSGSTSFFANFKDSGTVYVFERKDFRFVLVDDLESTTAVDGSWYGNSVSVDNDTILVGAPAITGLTTSTMYQFSKINTAITGFEVVSEKDDPIMIDAIQKVTLINAFTEEVVDYLDIVDPLKGKIVGIADQELKYKSAFDPAVYSVGTTSTVTDPESCWLDNHVGELWWDLSTAKYMLYEQSDLTYRKNNWGKLFPGATIDVYEWVGTNLLPSEWSQRADTSGGLIDGVSGQPKFIDNSSVSVKQVYDQMTNSFSNYYYYWVKNKITVPDVKNRRSSAYQVASIISDPAAYGIKFAAIIDSDAIALANVGPLLVDNRIHLNVSLDSSNKNDPASQTLKHTEWLLLQEGSATSKPTALLEKKLLDSLLGHDNLGNPVPNPTLSSRTRYGIGIRPQQTLFKDRLEALRNLVEFTNSVLIKNRITDNYSFTNLNKQDSIPDVYTHEYDQVVEDNEGLLIIDTRLFVIPTLTCTVANGKIRSVQIVNPGFGYKISPTVKIISDVSSDAEITTKIDPMGRVISATIAHPGNGFTSAPTLEVRQYTVIVQADTQFNGKWSKFVYNLDTEQWARVGTQIYNTPLYWTYVDWSSADYNPYVDYIATVDDVYEVNTLDLIVGQYVKVKNGGSGSYIILEKLNDTEVGTFGLGLNIVYSQNGTIQISDTIWDTKNSTLGFDQIGSFDQTLYDQTPDLELQYILLALKSDIFVNELKVNWNLFFFKAVKYALTEQKLLDWAFKTSFINVVNNAGVLDQRPVYKLSNTDYYEEYLKEVKPYHTNIRTFTANHIVVDPTQTYTTDFDLPSVYNRTTGLFESIETGSDKLSQYPWKSWADNNAYEIGAINVGIKGSGYTIPPIVEIVTAPGDSGSGATARAFIRSGEVTSIEVTNPGSGYTKSPTVSIIGGGDTTLTPAVAYAQLDNSKVRTNQISIKFDRISSVNQIGDKTVTDKFICNGSVNEFILSWLAEASKLNITITLNGNIVLSSDYTIEYYTAEYNGYNKQFSKVVFLNYVPAINQLLEITYLKSTKLFNATERILNYYSATSGMPGLDLGQLMLGIDYPKTKIEGLMFDKTQSWDLVFPNGEGTPFGESSYADSIGYYTQTTSSSTSTIVNAGTQTSVVLSTTTGIAVGQFVNVISTLTNAFTSSIVKVSNVNPLTRTVVFNTTTVATLNTGSVFEFWTYDANSNLLDSAIDGGNLSYTTAVGINPADINIDGDTFYSANTSHAPEEFVPGQASESIGINVYTKNPQGAPTVFTGSIPVLFNTVTTFALGMRPISITNISVNFNNTLLTYATNTNFLTTANVPQYQINWETNELVLGPQFLSGYLGYTITGIGGGRPNIEAGAIDTAVAVGQPYVAFEDVSSPAIQVVSLSSYDTIKSVYVTLNGVPVPEGVSGTTYYVLTYANENDKRAAVNVRNVPSNQVNTVQAWFFGTEYDYYNEIREQIITVSTTTNSYTLTYPPGLVEPIAASAIVEFYPTPGSSRRLVPPHITYYQVVTATNNTFVIDNTGVFGALDGTVRVYVNGVRLTGGFEFTVSSNVVTIIKPLVIGDLIAILDKPTGVNLDYNYDIVGNTLTFDQNVGPNLGWSANSTGYLRVLTYKDHDEMLMRTERFDGNPNRRFKLSRSVEDSKYVWVTLNGIPLTSGLDFEVLDDGVTIQISDNYIVNSSQYVVITSMVAQRLATTIVGYRIFNDMFNRTHFKRLSKKNTSYLTQPLKFTDTEIHVNDATVFAPPLVAMNIPGVVIIDGERIEFFTVTDTTLGQLKRSTLGTAPSFYSDIGTKVIDQSPAQTIPFSETIKNQYHYVSTSTSTLVLNTSTSSYTFIINTDTTSTVVPLSISTSTINSDGITLSTFSNAADQVQVFYGGRLLRKAGYYKQDTTMSYDSPDTKGITIGTTSTVASLPYSYVPGTAYVVTSTNQVWVYTGSYEADAVNGYVYRGMDYVPPEFSINVNTPKIALANVDVNGGTPPNGSGWVLPETTATMQIQPGWIMQDANGARYTVVYSGHNSLFNGWGVGFASAITILWPLTFIEPIVQQITLNIEGGVSSNIKLQIVKKEFEKRKVWNNVDPTDSRRTLSIMDSTSTQALFLQAEPAELPDKYYFGGDIALVTSGGSPLTDINNDPLEGF